MTAKQRWFMSIFATVKNSEYQERKAGRIFPLAMFYTGGLSGPKNIVLKIFLYVH
jgi:hypothetical protein